MSDLQKALFLLSPIILFSAGLLKTASVLIHRFGSEGMWTRFYGAIQQIPPYISHCAWSLSILAPLLLFALWIYDIATGKVLILKTDAGHPLRIRQDAVNRFIHECLIALPYVRKVRVSARSVRGDLAVRIRVWICASDKIGALQEEIIDTIRRDASRGFGVTRVLEPDVLIESVTSPKGKLPSASLSLEAPGAVACQPPAPQYIEPEPVEANHEPEPDESAPDPEPETPPAEPEEQSDPPEEEDEPYEEDAPEEPSLATLPVITIDEEAIVDEPAEPEEDTAPPSDTSENQIDKATP